MHYVFKSKADADLIMMKPVGDRILQIVGHALTDKGILPVASLPAAVTALESAIAQERRSDGTGAGADDEDGHEPRVGLHQRAWPMLEMMKRSIAEQADIVWGV